MFEIRPISREIPGQQKETPACEAGDFKNSKGMAQIVARPPCVGIVPRDFAAHLASISRQIDAVRAAQRAAQEKIGEVAP